MALHAEPLGGEGVVGVGLCRGVLHPCRPHALPGEGVSIHQVEGPPVEADIVPHHEVTGGEQAAVSLLNAVAPDQDPLWESNAVSTGACYEVE